MLRWPAGPPRTTRWVYITHPYSVPSLDPPSSHPRYRRMHGHLRRRTLGQPREGILNPREKACSSSLFLEGCSTVEGRELAEGTWQWPARPSGGNRRDCHTGSWARGFWEGWGPEGTGPHCRQGQSHLGAYSGLPELRRIRAVLCGTCAEGPGARCPPAWPPRLRVGRTGLVSGQPDRTG